MRWLAWSRAGLAQCVLLLHLQCCKAGIDDWWSLPSFKVGRQDAVHHSPRCCYAHDCLLQDRGQYAFVTTLRTPEYLVLVRELHCSLMRHNPGVRFIVAAVEGDLAPQMVEEIKTFAEYRAIEDLNITNSRVSRFSKNWCKLRVFGWTEFDAIVMLDSDIIVRGDLTHLFKLPTDFAWTMDSGPDLDIEAGAFIFLRPCSAVADDMLATAVSNKDLQFADGFAEQDFLKWYFKWSGTRLSSMYNMDSQVLQQTDFKTAGGADPLAIHFAFDKPFDVQPGDYRWPYLCWRPTQAGLGAMGSPIKKNLAPSTLPWNSSGFVLDGAEVKRLEQRQVAIEKRKDVGRVTGRVGISHLQHHGRSRSTRKMQLKKSGD